MGCAKRGGLLHFIIFRSISTYPTCQEKCHPARISYLSISLGFKNPKDTKEGWLMLHGYWLMQHAFWLMQHAIWLLLHAFPHFDCAGLAYATRLAVPIIAIAITKKPDRFLSQARMMYRSVLCQAIPDEPVALKQYSYGF